MRCCLASSRRASRVSDSSYAGSTFIATCCAGPVLDARMQEAQRLPFARQCRLSALQLGVCQARVDFETSARLHRRGKSSDAPRCRALHACTRHYNAFRHIVAWLCSIRNNQIPCMQCSCKVDHLRRCVCIVLRALLCVQRCTMFTPPHFSQSLHCSFATQAQSKVHKTKRFIV